MATKLTRVFDYAESRGIPAPLVRKWIRDGLLPAIQVKRAIFLDADECDDVLRRFKRGGLSLSAK